MSREVRSRAAQPRETKRSQPSSEGAFRRTGSAAVFAATNVAAKTAVFHTGERRHVSTAGSLFARVRSSGNQEFSSI